MTSSRRHFLGSLTAAGCAALAPPGVLEAVAVALNGSGSGRNAIRPDHFAGAMPGQGRTVEEIPLCWCPAGRFLMGSPATEPGRRADEEQVAVALSRGFWIGRTEVTQGQWQRIVGEFPDRLPSVRFGEGDDFPMYWVNYHEAELFCRNLTRRARAANTLPAGWEFRLPTEAQWEYACRAGTRTITSFGDSFDIRQINYIGQWEIADRRAPRNGGSRAVGSYPANAWGIHDMHGNVWEWCRDWYHARLPGGTDPDLHDMVGERNGDGSHSRVRRGGAWVEDGWACRAACRMRYEPPRRSDHIGFRVVAVEL